MGAALYLSLVLLGFFLVRAARSQIKGDGLTLSPREVPDGVRRATRKLAPRMTIASVDVAMDGPDAVRYRITGRLPGGEAVRLTLPSREMSPEDGRPRAGLARPRAQS